MSLHAAGTGALTRAPCNGKNDKTQIPAARCLPAGAAGMARQTGGAGRMFLQIFR
ncbi:MAG: hypothetical protein R3F42_07685 [Pseudomonadota bacterium]